MIEVFWMDKAGVLQVEGSTQYWWDEQVPSGVSLGMLYFILFYYQEAEE